MRKPLGFIAVAVLSLQIACSRDEIVSIDPDEAPGNSPPTMEVVFGPADLTSWIDSVFSGFSGAFQAPFTRVETSSGLMSRGLVRFTNIADTVFVVDTLSGVLSYDSARVVYSVDSTLSALPEGGAAVQLLAVAEDWDNGSTNWELAVDSPGVTIPWSTPGGALGQLLDEVELTEITDSIVFQLGEATDSILRAWLDTTSVNTGFIVVLPDSGRLYLQLPVLRYFVVPEVAPDTSIQLSSGASQDTYIFDPSAGPPSAGVSRMGGVEGWRIYTEMLLPDSVMVEGFTDPQPLLGSTINLSELLLISLPPPDPPFAAERAYAAVSVRLADDYLIFGDKTPVGNLVGGSDFTVDPDSLAAGSVLGVDLTALIRDWARTPPDSTPPAVRFALRSLPEASTFGFWEFGAADGDPAFEPVLRIVFTPPTRFAVP